LLRVKKKQIRYSPTSWLFPRLD